MMTDESIMRGHIVYLELLAKGPKHGGIENGLGGKMGKAVMKKGKPIYLKRRHGRAEPPFYPEEN